MIDHDLIQKQLEEMLRLHTVPSVSVTIYNKGNYQHFSAGHKDMETSSSPDQDTLYAIGSCTKSFTAGAIGILCDQGLLDLDAPVQKYIPEFQMYDSYAGIHLTVRDMLCHRCGLPRHELAWYPWLDQFTESDIIRIFRYLEPNQPFRYKMQYQNLMYALAGFVISRVSGMPWTDFIEKYLIAPLDFGQAAYDADDLLSSANHAKGYRLKKTSGRNEEVAYATLGAMNAAGSMGLGSRQLAMWNVLLMHEGNMDGRQIISQKMVREMTSPQMLVSDPVAAPLVGSLSMQSYGLGLFVENYRGHTVVQHSGHIDGFIADQCFIPSEDFACTVLTNSESPYGARAIRFCLLDAMLGLEAKPWIEDLAKFYHQTIKSWESAEETVSDPAYPCPVSLEKICGQYENPGYGPITVTAKDDQLFVKLGTLTLKGRHCRGQYFIFTEDHVLTGERLEGQIDLNIAGDVIGIGIKLDSASEKPVYFKNTVRVP